MSARGRSKSSLFLMELIIAILFFSIASAVCIRLFAVAHLESLQSAQLNRAVFCAQSAADALSAANGDPEQLTGLIGASKTGAGEFSARYDAQCRPTASEAKTAYALNISTSGGNNGVLTADIEVFGIDDPDKPLFTLQTKRYIPAV